MQDDYLSSVDVVIQNVTADTLTGIKPSIVIAVIKECLIKEDIITRKVTAVPVSQETASLFSEYMIRTEENELPVYYRMELFEENKFDLSVIDGIDAEDIDNDIMYELCIDDVEQLKKIDLIMRQPDGKYGIIMKTGKSVFLNTSGYSRTDISRGEAFIDAFAPELCDINFAYTSANTSEYYIGVPQRGMERDVVRNNTIREIVFQNSCPDLYSFFSDFDTNMLRATGPSVLPFAAKYLREFAKMAGDLGEDLEI